jgi:hypothetical protein
MIIDKPYKIKAQHYLKKKQGEVYHAWRSESSILSAMYQEDVEPSMVAGDAQQGPRAE